MNKILISLWLSFIGTACYAQAAASNGGLVLDSTPATIFPIILLVAPFPLFYFLAFKPTRRNMTEKNLSLLAAVPPGKYITLGLMLLAGAYVSMVFGDSIRFHKALADSVLVSWMIYSGYFIGVLGGILIMTALFKGIASKQL